MCGALGTDLACIGKGKVLLLLEFPAEARFDQKMMGAALAVGKKSTALDHRVGKHGSSSGGLPSQMKKTVALRL